MATFSRGGKSFKRITKHFVAPWSPSRAALKRWWVLYSANLPWQTASLA
jgi:hypothetical protein